MFIMSYSYTLLQFSNALISKNSNIRYLRCNHFESDGSNPGESHETVVFWSCDDTDVLLTSIGWYENHLRILLTFQALTSSSIYF